MASQLLSFPFFYLQKSGILLNGSSKIALLVSIAALIFFIFFQVLSLAQLIFINGNVFTFIDNIESIGAFLQISGKMGITIYYRKKIIDLMDLSKYFWKANICSEIVENKINGFSKQVYYFQKLLLYSFSISAGLIILTVLFFGKSLPIGVWQIENHPRLHMTLIIIMDILVGYAIFIVASFDNLYLGFCCEMIAQFKILRHQLEKLDVEAIKSRYDFIRHSEKLNISIKHHKFLLSYLNDIRYIYSPALMIECIAIVPLICSELYLITQNTDPAIITRCGFTVVAQTLQLTLYCLSADFVSNEASKISFAIYSSNWYSQHFKTLRAPIQLLIQAAQQDVEFTACGLIKINANTMVQVFRVAMSTNAILRNVNN